MASSRLYNCLTLNTRKELARKAKTAFRNQASYNEQNVSVLSPRDTLKAYRHATTIAVLHSIISAAVNVSCPRSNV
ncbi:hypothetical protein PTI98_007891 [Pleurotus ostreatus]|nr:hypothetical protein PTI98_007891 [Pleurotus ostreatus]